MSNFETRITEDGNMVAPGRRGDINNFRMRIVTSNECTTDTKSACARDGLGNGYLKVK
jgi:hypothetical protein